MAMREKQHSVSIHEYVWADKWLVADHLVKNTSLGIRESAVNSLKYDVNRNVSYMYTYHGMSLLCD